MDLPDGRKPVAVGDARMRQVVMGGGHLAAEHPVRRLQAACGHLQDANKRSFGFRRVT